VRSDGSSVVTQRFLDPQSLISVAVHSRGALLSWSQFKGGKPRVYSRWLGLEAEAVDAPDITDDSVQLDAYSSPTSTGFITTWSDDVSGQVQLRARRSDDQGATLDATPVALTTDAVGHRNSVSAQGADGKILVAFTTAESPHGRTLLLGADAQPIGDAHDVPDFGASVGRPALAAFATGYVLVWVDADARRVHLQRLDAAGVPAGASALLDSEGSAEGNVDIATAATNGAVAWDVLVDGARAEVRFRTFGADAAPTGIEQKLTPYPETGLHPSLVAARGGYIVAYRSARASSLTLRLVLLDGRGKPVSASSGALNVASLLQQDLPLSMRIANDGRSMFVGWVDRMPNTSDYQLQRAWIECD
jgi:hypothetical protein